MVIDINEDNKQTIYKIVIGVGIVIILLTFLGIYVYDKKRNKEVVTVERITKEYEIVKTTGPSPFIITVKDPSTGTVYLDSFVSDTCPQFSSKPQNGKFIFTKFTNIKIKGNEKSYFFKGAYEQLCTNMKFDPKAGDNYYRQ